MSENPSKRARRSRTTNDPIRARHKATTSRGLRVRDLYDGFLGDHDRNDVVVQAAALRCAELVAESEDIRAEMRGEGTSIADRSIGQGRKPRHARPEAA